MDSQKNIYPQAVAAMAFIAIVLVSFGQYDRIVPAYRDIFIACRVFFSLAIFAFVIYFWKKDFDDIAGSIFTIILLQYVLVMMWFMPLYEIAYIQVAMGTAFFRFRRTWIHTVLLGAGLVCLIATYKVQAHFAWVLPPIEQMDWIFSMVVLFAVTACVQKFAISSFQKDADNLRRFGVIGRDAARLTHDLKGLLSSPMLILESFRDKSLNFPPDFYERQMSYLISDMDKVRETIKGINRLAVVSVKFETISVNSVLQGAVGLLERRLQDIKITMPDDRVVTASSEHLHSIFFNLLINSIQAFERYEKQQGQEIHISWEGNTLQFRDNAGGLKTAVAGLGLELVKSDSQLMNAKFSVDSVGEYTIAKIKFNRAAVTS